MKHSKLAKKLLTMLLCVAMLVSMLPTYVMAADIGTADTGSAEVEQEQTGTDAETAGSTAKDTQQPDASEEAENVQQPDASAEGTYDEQGIVLPENSTYLDTSNPTQYVLGTYREPDAKCDVTYTDGVEGEEIFADQSYSVEAGTATPAFEGTPTRQGYTFGGWSPDVAETVTGDVTYTAIWVPDKPDQFGKNVTDDFVKFVCDSDPDHHDDVMVSWVSNYTKATSDPVWNEEYNTWTVGVRLDAIKTMYLWMNYDKKVGVDHELVAGSPVPEGQDHLDITMKWDAASEQWVNLDGNPIEFHVTCKTMPTAPTSISGYQVKMVDAEGKQSNWFVKVPSGTYEIGEVKGNRDDGFTVDVTLNFADNDAFLESWTAKKGEGYHYDHAQTPESITVTLTYGGSLTGNLSSGPWKLNGKTSGTIATVYVTTAYTVTLDANGGTVDPTELTVTYNTALGQLPAPTRDGYTFAGWVDEDGNAVTANTVYTKTVDSVLTATWTANQYTVTLDANGGKVDPSEINVTYDSAVGQLPTPTRDGYTFAGWVDEDGNAVTADTLYQVVGNSTLTATWVPAAPDKYGNNVTDDFVKIVCDSDSDHHADSVASWMTNYTKATSDPVWNDELNTWTVNVRLNTISVGYLWKYNKNVGVTHTLVADKPVPADENNLDITMKWDAATEQWVHLNDQPLELHVACQTMPTAPTSLSGFQVKMVDAAGQQINWFVHVPDGTYEIGEVKGNRDDGFTVDVTLNFADNDAFLQAWAAKRGEGYAYDAQSPASVTVTLTYGGSLTGNLSNGPWELNGKTYGTIATVYVTNVYTVTLDAKGGTVDPTEITATYNTALGQLPTPTRDGYTFTGWVDENGNAVTADTLYQVVGNSTLTATWAANQYTVTLDANGGKVDPSEITVTYDSAVGELPVPTRTGYTFAGWVDEDGNAVTADTLYQVAGNSTLSATWTANQYTMALDANGGKVDPSEITVTYGSAVGELPVPTRTGYTFAGWYDAQGTKVGATSVYLMEGNTTLNAKWTANQYTVTVDPANGEKPSDITVTFDAPIGKLPTPARDGYKFGGWYDQNGNLITADSIYNVAGNLTLTAKWISVDTAPQTGDNSGLYLMSTLLAASAAAFVVLFTNGKKKERK